ncbi:MAG: hypothetical protein F6K17_21075 [Okeania sp. SIO3C4]|nr:hypothetical protein [Okeania sp. SIO3B3]NER04914.1 hypothetical protein [Okeania sp. SIO3C4]
MVGKQEGPDNAKNSKQIPWGGQRKNISGLDSSSIGVYRTAEDRNGGKNESLRSFGTNIEGKNAATTATATIDREGGCPKKLASQLELLKKAFYEYVGAHRGRLEQRLDENKQFTQVFEKRLAELEQEILGSPQHHTKE